MAQCKCNLDAKLCTVKKAGPNEGKQFYACPKPQAEQCSYFEWTSSVAPRPDTALENHEKVMSALRQQYAMIETHMKAVATMLKDNTVAMAKVNDICEDIIRELKPKI